MTRRVFLKAGGTAAMGAWLVTGCGGSSSSSAPAVLPPVTPPVPDVDEGHNEPDRTGPIEPTPLSRFLTDEERITLRGLVDRLIPGGLFPGAAEAGADAAIDAFLGAFNTSPPLIFAGGPFSDRGGASFNDFQRFVPLDDYDALAWRTVIEGSQGRPEREFNGPVKGLQAIYREGLARLEERASSVASGILPSAIADADPLQPATGLLGSITSVVSDTTGALLGDTPLSVISDLVNALTGNETFAELPGLLRDLILFDPTDEVIQELVDVAFPATLDGTYGAPEYGGNKDQVIWSSIGFDGDVQPRGYSDHEVINPDNPGLLDVFLPESYGGNPVQPRRRVHRRAPMVGPSTEDFLALAPMLGGGEGTAAMVTNAQGRLSKLQQQLAYRRHNDAIWVWSANDA